MWEPWTLEELLTGLPMEDAEAYRDDIAGHQHEYHDHPEDLTFLHRISLVPDPELAKARRRLLYDGSRNWWPIVSCVPTGFAGSHRLCNWGARLEGAVRRAQSCGDDYRLLVEANACFEDGRASVVDLEILWRAARHVHDHEVAAMLAEWIVKARCGRV